MVQKVLLWNSLDFSVLTLMKRWVWLLQVWMEQIWYYHRDVGNIFSEFPSSYNSQFRSSQKQFSEIWEIHWNFSCFSWSYVLVVWKNCVLTLSLLAAQEFGNIETPIYSRLRHFLATIYSRSVFLFLVCNAASHDLLLVDLGNLIISFIVKKDFMLYDYILFTL